jgi:catechol 2,3-dioxygenase-like lactoylglutathione lyase family enzyme
VSTKWPTSSSVDDQDRAVEFYTEKLGLEKRIELPFGPGFRWIEVAPGGADTSIALCPQKNRPALSARSLRTTSSSAGPLSAGYCSICVASMSRH